MRSSFQRQLSEVVKPNLCFRYVYSFSNLSVYSSYVASSSPACPKKMASIWNRLSRCLSTALSGMVCAHSSNASLLVPKPKLRARVMKNTSSQLLLYFPISLIMRSVFSSKRSIWSVFSQLCISSLDSDGMSL